MDRAGSKIARRRSHLTPGRAALAALFITTIVPLSLIPLQARSWATSRLHRPPHSIQPIKLRELLLVNTTSDEVVPGDGLCSLREAIITSNAAGSVNNDCGQGTGFDTIHFTVGGTIALGSALPAITQDLIIDGTTNTIAIDGANTFQVFAVNSGATLGLNNLTIQHGANSGGDGGGIGNGGTLSLTNSTISGNSAEFGGGIVNGGTATVTNSTISANSAENGTPFDADGGGIANDGMLTVTNSAISGNSADYGAGIFNGEFGTATVTDSTISGNSASGQEEVGGGIDNDGTLTVTNSTIAGNTASPAGDSGGGISNEQLGTLTVTNSTIAGNSASDEGGGIFNAGNTTFKNTIIASSTGGNCVPSGAANAALTSDGHNLSDDKTCAFAGPGDQNSIAAGLDPAGLHNNGGATETIALLPTSPAVDAVPMSPTNYCTEIDGTTPITTDQRGDPRPDPEDGLNGPCDIGAYEFQSPTEVSGKLKVSPTTLKFGDVTVNDAVIKTVTIKNAGKTSKKNHPMPIMIEMEAVNQTPSPFSVTMQCSDVELMPGGKGVPKSETMCVAKVQFMPTQAIAYSGTMTIADALAPNEMQTVQMTGKGKLAK